MSKLKKQYREEAGRADTVLAAACVISDLLAHLENLHVWVKAGDVSSAESFALMLAQCPQVTTMGDVTAGSSANPRRLELDCGITVNLPRWLDMDPSKKPIEHAGIAPAVRVKADPEDFGPDRDPVLEAALERLRAIPAAKRAPGRRQGG